MFHFRSFCNYTRIGLILLTAAIVGCKGPSELSQLPVYSEAFQRTYFEAQNHLAKGDPESAYAGFMECLEKEPNEGSLHFDLGKIDLEFERWDAALMHFAAANKIDSENRWYREFRAQTNMHLERYEEANEDLLWILEHRPGDFEWAMEWTLRLADAGGLDAALSLCEAYEKAIPNDPDILLQKLYLMELSQDYLGIYRTLESAVIAHPNQFDFKLQWAQMLLATEQEDAALDILLQLQRLDPRNGLVQLELAEVWTSRNELEKAQQALFLAFDSEDVLVEEKHDILVQYLNLASYNPALLEPLENLMGRAVELHGEDGNIRMLASDLAQILGQPTLAKEHMQKAVVAMPHIPSAWTNLIALDAELDEYEAMIQHAKEALDRFPLEAEFYLFAGIGSMVTGELEEAVRYFKGGLGVVLDTPLIEGQLAGLLGDVLHMQGDVEPAEAAYERSLSKVPTNPTFLNNHAYRLAQSKRRLDRAYACSSMAIELAPDEANFLDTHAWVLYQMERYPEALDYITQALFLANGNDGTFWEHDGDIRSAMGDHEGALNSWNTALERGGNSESLKRKIEEGS
jgi:tetratricopeptide (TPR) repeat protein